jgi:UDP-3-O-acyl N-acetylglucosamine deacetylase
MSTQSTIAREIRCRGIGLHTGQSVNLKFLPAPPNSGIIFKRTDLPQSPAIYLREACLHTGPYCLILEKDEIHIQMAEHLLGTILGLGIDNLILELDSLEVPIMDGSALSFVTLLEQAGIISQNGTREKWILEKPVWYFENSRGIIALPWENFQISYLVSYSHPLIGLQYAEFIINKSNFVQEISPARTFGWWEEIQEQRKSGLIKGGSLDNAIVFGEKNILNPEQLRFPDEVVRHKILDLMGSLATLEGELCLRVIAIKSGHALDTRLVSLLKENLKIISQRSD